MKNFKVEESSLTGTKIAVFYSQNHNKSIFYVEGVFPLVAGESCYVQIHSYNTDKPINIIFTW